MKIIVREDVENDDSALVVESDDECNINFNIEKDYSFNNEEINDNLLVINRKRKNE